MRILTITFLTLLLPLQLIHSSPTLRPGWPVYIGTQWSAWKHQYLTLWTHPNGVTTIGASSINTIALLDLDGNFLEGWPVTWESPQEVGYLIKGPMMGDLTGDGLPEIVVLIVTTESTVHYRTYNYYGEEISELRRVHDYTTDFVTPRGAPVLADVDGDGRDEMFYLADSMLYAMHGDGTQLDGFPWDRGERDGAHLVTVAIGCGQEWGGEPVLVWGTRSMLHARLLSSEEELPGWPVVFQQYGQDLYYSPVTLIGTAAEWRAGVISENYVYMYSMDGEAVSGFPALNPATANYFRQSYDLVAADLTGDGTPELLFKNFGYPLHALDIQGNSVPGYPVAVGNNGGGEPPVATVVAGETHIFGSCLMNGLTHYNLYGLANSTMAPGFPVSLPAPEGANAHSLTAAFNSTPTTLHIVQGSPFGRFYLYDLQLESPIDRYEWPMPGNTSGGNRYYRPTLPTAAEERPSNPPEHPGLGMLYPNPTNGWVSLEIPLSTTRRTSVTVYNIIGQQVHRATLPRAAASRQMQRWLWDGIGKDGSFIPSGVYIVQIEGDQLSTRRLTMVR